MCISEGLIQVFIVSYHHSVYCCSVAWSHTIATGSEVQPKQRTVSYLVNEAGVKTTQYNKVTLVMYIIAIVVV